MLDGYFIDDYDFYHISSHAEFVVLYLYHKYRS